MEIKYKNYKIKYDEYDDKWVCNLNSDRLCTDITLSKIKKKIDTFIKKEKNFISINAYMPIYYDFKEVIITSITEDKKYAWIKQIDKSKSKVYLSNLYRFDKANKNILETINKKYKDIENIEKQIRDLKRKITKFILPV